ncbi:MAG TPA: M50 family metallopeptidase [Tepidisphaeraceae bacterium]|nr:M50 family metallopeptidase [Tepidisphaeraceae bacterium]
MLRAAWWLVTGNVRLFEVFGITVRAHAAMLVITAIVLVFGLPQSKMPPVDKIQFVTVLWISILLHEFGHCWGARRTGGEANDILLTPLGGLAFTMSRRRPWPTFFTVIAGPLVTLAILLTAIGAYWIRYGELNAQTISFFKYYSANRGIFSLDGWIFWAGWLNAAMLAFNLLPIWPLDGGQMFQAVLWKPLGYYRSMMLALNVGIAGNLVLMMIGLSGVAGPGGGLTFFIGLASLLYCIAFRRQVLEHGPWAFSDEDSADFGNPWKIEPERKPGPVARLREKREVHRMEKAKQTARQDELTLDALLSKISKSGIDSLTTAERKELERLRQRKSVTQK